MVAICIDDVPLHYEYTSVFSYTHTTLLIIINMSVVLVLRMHGCMTLNLK